MMNFQKNELVYDLLSSIVVVPDDEDEKKIVVAIKACSKPVIVSFVNAHAVNLAISKPEFFNDLSSSDFIFRDGIGVKMLMLSLGLAPGKNMNGTDLIPRFFDYFRTGRFAFYGTSEPWLSSTVDFVSEKINVVDFENGFHANSFYVQKIMEKLPDVIVLGMGMPKQESLSVLIRESCNHPCVIINGGAVIDFIGGRFPRAPSWMRAYGLEWIFRLKQEPKRMFSRYVVGGFKSISVFVICLFRRNKFKKTKSI